MRVWRLETPVDRETAARLRAGDIVYITGVVIAARDQAHRLILERGGLPFDARGYPLMHAGIVARREGGEWKVYALGSTTSRRMARLLPRVVEVLDTPLVIGKGGVAEASGELVRLGVPYLTLPGGVAASTAASVVRVEGVYWLEELGATEAVWLLRVKELGPLIVTLDTRGVDLLSEVQARAESILRELLEARDVL